MPEAKIDLTGISKTINPHFRQLVKDRHPIQLVIGGANSSKSYSTAQKVVYHTLGKNYCRTMATRKVKKDVRHSVFDFTRAVIADWKMERFFSFNKTECNVICKLNGNDILGAGLDDVNKLKSIYNPTLIWMEEADQSTPNDIEQLNLRLRGPETSFYQMILTMNPISTMHFIKTQYWDSNRKDIFKHHSTYKDNLHLPKQIIERMEAITDPYYYKVYVLGEWGIFANGVFTNYVIEDFDYTEDDLENVSTGMDYGFVHASAIERCGFREGELYVFDEVYGKNWTNTDFIQNTLDYFGEECKGWPITPDSAEPDRIEEWRRIGFINLSEAKKGPGSLKYGIDYLCSIPKIHIHQTKCPNLAREIQLYKRREDKDGNVMDAFVEVNDDCIAALRYATEYIWSNQNSYYVESDWSLSELGL